MESAEERRTGVADNAAPVPLTRLVDALDAPPSPADGDCIRWSREVTAVLVAAEMPARTVLVYGWLDDQRTVLLFAHQATAVGDDIVDVTARQFSSELPRRWIAPAAVYAQTLAARTNIAAVTIA